MFPFLFGFFGIDMFDKLFNSKPVTNTTNPNNTSYQPNFNIDTFQPSDEILKFQGFIEGFFTKAYKDGKGIVTVGTGLTFFSNGTKPVFGQTYAESYLISEKRWHDKSNIQIAKNIMKKFPKLVQVFLNQQIADVIFDMSFQGFTSGRQLGFYQSLQVSKASLANYLLSNMGLWGGNIWVSSSSGYTSRFGLLKRGYWRANYIYGTKKSYQECDNFINSFRNGKLKIPNFI